MEVILLPKRSSGPHGVRLGVDEIALSCMLLVPSRRGEDATLPSTIPRRRRRRRRRRREEEEAPAP